MSSADIDEIYEKLLKIYEVRYNYANPRMMLYYRINQLVREGRTREEVIKTLYEEEGELTSEEEKKLEGSTRRKKGEEAIKKTKQCPQCGKDVLIGFKLCPHCDFDWTLPYRPSHTSYVKKPTSLWYLVPLLLGLIGGVLGYIAVKDEDKEMAETLLVIGIVMSFIDILVIWAIYSYYLSMLSRLL